MEAAIADVDEGGDSSRVDARRSATENLPLRQRRDLWDCDTQPGGLQLRFHRVDCGVELDRADEREVGSGVKVPHDRRDEVRGVDSDRDEDVECFDLGDVNWDQTRVRIVYQQVAAERARREVVDAARAVCDVAHDHGLGTFAERLDYISDGAGEQQQALRHLQCHPGSLCFADIVDRLVDFEVVVGWEEPNRCVERRVVEDLEWDLGYCPAAGAAGFGGDCQGWVSEIWNGLAKGHVR